MCVHTHTQANLDTCQIANASAFIPAFASSLTMLSSSSTNSSAAVYSYSYSRRRLSFCHICSKILLAGCLVPIPCICLRTLAIWAGGRLVPSYLPLQLRIGPDCESGSPVLKRALSLSLSLLSLSLSQGCHHCPFNSALCGLQEQ